MGFTGTRCESFVEWCMADRSPCLNGGTCVQRSNHYECLCQRGWEGLNCDIPAMSCAAISASRGMIQQRFNGPFFQDNPGELAPELSETLTQDTTLVVFRFLTNTPNLPSQAFQSTSRL